MQARERELRKVQTVANSPPPKDTTSVYSVERVSPHNISLTDVQLSKKFDINGNALNMNLKTNINAPTTIPDLGSPSPNAAQPSEKGSTMSATPSNMPYPFMQGFVDRSMGNRFSKRVNFDRSEYDDLLGQIIDQIHEKRDRELFEKIREREDEQGLLELQKKLMTEEVKYETEDKTNKTNAFIMANQILKDEKEIKKENERRLKSIERLNYFPFTHGDMIEK